MCNVWIEDTARTTWNQNKQRHRCNSMVLFRIPFLVTFQVKPSQSAMNVSQGFRGIPGEEGVTGELETVHRAVFFHKRFDEDLGIFPFSVDN